MTLLSFSEGGYFSWAWRTSAVAFASAAGLSLVLRGRAAVTRLQILAVAAMAAFCGWTALSGLWSLDQDASLQEAQRTLVYVTAVVAAIVIRGSLLAGTLAGIAIVAAYAVGQRLVEGPPSPPDPFEETLLHEPLGYANALGGLAAIGIAAAVALLVEQRRFRVLVGATAALLIVTLALTGSRGGWVAALVGTAVAMTSALRRPRLARAVIAFAGVALIVVLALPASRSLAEDLAMHGGDRPFYWHVAWQEAAAAPLVGNGAGTFELLWAAHRPVPVAVRDAHSLYLETFAELGVVGLALLAFALAPPLVAGLRSRVAAAATGGYAAFLVHAGVDWDWEMPAVTVTGLLCGATLLLEDRRDTPRKFRAQDASTVVSASHVRDA